MSASDSSPGGRTSRAIAELRRDWEHLATVDPLWAILSDPSKRGGRWDLDAFLATGERDVAELVDLMRLDEPLPKGSALDFGCGVGRLTRALARRFDVTVGVDISCGMIERAKAINADVPNARFVCIDDHELAQLGNAKFDLVLSLFVLQHFPSEALIRSALRALISRVRPHGVAVIQLPDHIPMRHRLQARPRLYRMLRGLRVSDRLLQHTLGLHPIRMRGLPQPEVESILREGGFTITQPVRTPMKGTRIYSVLYVAHRLPTS